jgi:hypothetical protein
MHQRSFVQSLSGALLARVSVTFENFQNTSPLAADDGHNPLRKQKKGTWSFATSQWNNYLPCSLK